MALKRFLLHSASMHHLPFGSNVFPASGDNSAAVQCNNHKIIKAFTHPSYFLNFPRVRMWKRWNDNVRWIWNKQMWDKRWGFSVRSRASLYFAQRFSTFHRSLVQMKKLDEMTEWRWCHSGNSSLEHVEEVSHTGTTEGLVGRVFSASWATSALAGSISGGCVALQ